MKLLDKWDRVPWWARLALAAAILAAAYWVGTFRAGFDHQYFGTQGVKRQAPAPPRSGRR